MLWLTGALALLALGTAIGAMATRTQTALGSELANVVEAQKTNAASEEGRAVDPRVQQPTEPTSAATEASAAIDQQAQPGQQAGEQQPGQHTPPQAEQQAARSAAQAGLSTVANRGQDGRRRYVTEFGDWDDEEDEAAERAVRTRRARAITRRRVARTLDKVTSRVRRCYDLAMLPGKVDVRLAVRGYDGHVESAKVSPGGPTGDCVSKVMSELRFPTFRQQRITIRKPYRFQ